jgi:monoamine oxidase
LEDTLFFAGEATNTEGHQGTVHGAIATGLRAAQEISRGFSQMNADGT